MTIRKTAHNWLDLFAARRRTPALGRRELSVLEALWETDSLSVQQVHDALTDEVISLNTVQSTLERLHRKRLARREKSGRAYYYSAGVSRTEIISSLLSDITEDIAGGDIATVVSGFQAFLGDRGDDPKDGDGET